MMAETATAPRSPTQTSPADAGSARATPRALELASRPRHALEAAFLRGATPATEALVGWEFRGINTPSWARLAGIKKFVKGFIAHEDGRITGYNCPVVQDGLARPWRTLPDDSAPKRFGFYAVTPVDPTSRDNAYLHALLLDYGAGGNKPWDPSRGLRDYLVEIDRDLYLGKAYYALGPIRLGVSFFVLERFRRGLTDYAHR
jgi:hypothetical protein